MQKMSLSYVVPFNKRYQRSGHLFQGRFQAKLVVDTRYLIHLSRYIHLNPQSANLVKHAEEWDYSSLNEYIGTKPIDFANPNVILDLMDNGQGSSLLKKQQEYKKFILDFDPEYMSFKEK